MAATDNVVEVVCELSQAFLSGVAEHLPNAEMKVDWFHTLQTFTRTLDETYLADILAV